MKDLQEYKEYIVSGDVNQVRFHPPRCPPIHPSTHPFLTIARVSPRSPAARWAALESVTNFLRKPDIRCTGPYICNPCVLMHLCNIVATWG